MSMRSKPNPTLRAFSLVELLMVIAIIAVLVAITIPALSNARAVAKAAKCKAQMRQVYQSIEHYRGDYRDFYPATYLLSGSTLWDNEPWRWNVPIVRCLDLIQPYLNVPMESLGASTPSANILLCPFANIRPTMVLAEVRQTAFSTSVMYANYWQSARFGYNGSSVKYRNRKTPLGPPDQTVLFADIYSVNYYLFGHNTLNPNYMTYVHPQFKAHIVACDGRLVETRATTASELATEGLSFVP